jgi:hypothetical protein
MSALSLSRARPHGNLVRRPFQRHARISSATGTQPVLARSRVGEEHDSWSVFRSRRSGRNPRGPARAVLHYFRSAAQSLRRVRDDCGWLQASREAPSLHSHCLRCLATPLTLCDKALRHHGCSTSANHRLPLRLELIDWGASESDNSSTGSNGTNRPHHLRRKCDMPSAMRNRRGFVQSLRFPLQIVGRRLE